MSQGFAKKDFADPGWQDYVPTFTNFTLGNGTIDDARYTQIGTTVHFYVQITLGSTSSMSTDPTISVPVSIASNLDNGYDLLGTVYMVNEGTQAYFGHIRKATTTSVLLIAINETGAVPNTTNITSSVPFTWGSTDRIIIQGTYEAATSALIDLGANDDHGSLSGLSDNDHTQYFHKTADTIGDMTDVTEWTTWSPSYTNLTIGNGTVVARYAQIGNTVLAYWSFTLGTTSAVGTAPTVSLPVTASSNWSASNLTNLGPAVMVETGVVSIVGHVRLASTTTGSLRVGTASGTYVQSASISATVPHTWGNTDVITFNIQYEAA